MGHWWDFFTKPSPKSDEYLESVRARNLRADPTYYLTKPSEEQKEAASTEVWRRLDRMIDVFSNNEKLKQVGEEFNGFERWADQVPTTTEEIATYAAYKYWLPHFRKKLKEQMVRNDERASYDRLKGSFPEPPKVPLPPKDRGIRRIQ